jgi:MtN3 and saliva related transmembrane protein
MFWQFIGMLAALLTMFSFVPQIIKTAASRSARDVSIITLLQLGSGVSLWIIYGIYRRDVIIVAANVITLLSLLLLIGLYFRFKPEEARGNNTLSAGEQTCRKG